jgi:lipopolysaccharide/colanic/teichoic acid biosynthesis glycosyltransferase
MPGLEVAQTLLRSPDDRRSMFVYALPGTEAHAAPAGLDQGDAVQDALGAGAKRALDLLGASALLLLCLPVFLVIAALVRLDGGPVFYAHERVGRGGRLFGCLKFRSMVADADRRLAALLDRDPQARAEWEATRKLKSDPRITAFGRFLRASSLDELPQILNVLAGHMSLVGPRPVQAAELAVYYGPAAQHYMAVRPGITGPWQVSGRNDTSYAQRVALDVAYARQPSLLGDLKILLRTPMAVLARRGAY